MINVNGKIRSMTITRLWSLYCLRQRANTLRVPRKAIQHTAVGSGGTKGLMSQNCLLSWVSLSKRLRWVSWLQAGCLVGRGLPGKPRKLSDVQV